MVTDMADKAQYAKPASQVDLEERLENGNRSFRELSTSDTYEGPKDDNPEGRDFRVKGNNTDAYVGTSPEYATYANKTEAPLASKDDDSAEAQVFEEFAGSALPATLKIEGNVEYEGELESKEAAKAASEAARAKAEGSDEEPEEEEEEEKTPPATPPSGN